MNYNSKRILTGEERDRLNIFSPFLSQLLFHRGLVDNHVAKTFLEPDYERDIHDPFLFKDMAKAVDRVIFAIKNNQKLAIYADYDADGIPGAAMWHDFFGRIGFENFVIYIPHRHDEGFGLNVGAIENLAKEEVKLVVTLDCGIADVLPVKRANELALEIIITDHHEPPMELPAAFAIIDHKQQSCNYPDKNLCGTGVAFKFIQAILKKERFGLKDGMEKWLLDLVGMATLSDMVPLVGENRVFAFYGLSVLRKSPRKGLVRLLEKMKIKKAFITEDDIAFMITPRINAASRMGVPMDAFKLLTAGNDTDADHYADHLDKINNERKGVVASLVKEIKKNIHERYLNFEGLPSVIVMGNPSWRPSLLGLAANTCAEEFDRPVFLWGRDGDNAIKGSCRSEGRTHVVELMRAVPAGVFTQYGGHKHSGGFAVDKGSVHYLEQRLNEAVLKMTNTKVQNLSLGGSETTGSGPESHVDMELKIDSVNWDLYNELAKLAPFGTGNPKPLFVFRNIMPDNVKVFGKGNEHMEITLKKITNERISAISFFGAGSEWAKSLLSKKQSIDIVGSLEKSHFRNRPELRIRIEDVIVS